MIAADQTGERWIIQVKSSGLYLDCESPPEDNVPLVVSTIPFYWRISIITQNTDHYKYVVSRTAFSEPR